MAILAAVGIVLSIVIKRKQNGLGYLDNDVRIDANHAVYAQPVVNQAYSGITPRITPRSSPYYSQPDSNQPNAYDKAKIFSSNIRQDDEGYVLDVHVHSARDQNAIVYAVPVEEVDDGGAQQDRKSKHKASVYNGFESEEEC